MVVYRIVVPRVLQRILTRMARLYVPDRWLKVGAATRQRESGVYTPPATLLSAILLLNALALSIVLPLIVTGPR